VHQLASLILFRSWLFVGFIFVVFKYKSIPPVFVAGNIFRGGSLHPGIGKFAHVTSVDVRTVRVTFGAIVEDMVAPPFPEMTEREKDSVHVPIPGDLS
jgi:hypothetical protein